MGQQPNIPLTMEDLPRPVPRPAAPRRWTPRRPGDMDGPADMPWGDHFGTPAPDAGYALRLVRDQEPDLPSGESRADAEAAIAAVASARASHFGRAPTMKDVETAMVILGYDDEGVPRPLVAGLAADRLHWVANLAHRPGAAADLVARVPVSVLGSSPEQLRGRMAAGERLIGTRGRDEA